LSPEPPALSAPAVQEKYGEVLFVQPLLATVVPPLLLVMAKADALVVGAVVSVVNPMEIWGMVGLSAPPKLNIALTDIFWEVIGSACMAVWVSCAAVLTVVVVSVAAAQALPVQYFQEEPDWQVAPSSVQSWYLIALLPE